MDSKSKILSRKLFGHYQKKLNQIPQAIKKLFGNINFEELGSSFDGFNSLPWEIKKCAEERQIEKILLLADNSNDEALIYCKTEFQIYFAPILRTIFESSWVSQLFAPFPNKIELQTNLQLHIMKNVHATSSQCWYFWKSSSKCRQGRVGFFNNYPVLTHLICKSIFHSICNAKMLSSRLLDDEKLLKTQFDIDIWAGFSITWGLSDKHRDGLSVAKIKFKYPEITLFYKPRHFHSDQLFKNLYELINNGKCIFQPEFIDKGKYGYVKEVTQNDLANEEEALTYYERLGELTIFAYLCGLNDIHSENIIANGKTPVIIDFEAMCDPRPRCSIFAATESGADFLAIQNTPLRTGLLPFPMEVNGEVTDLSGIGGVGSQKSPVTSLIIPSSQKTRLVRGAINLKCRANTPKLSGRICKIIEHEGAFSLGVDKEIAKIERNKTKILNALEKINSEGLQHRWVCRPTAFYEKALEGILHPLFAEDFELADMLILSKLTLHRTWFQKKIMLSERNQLWNGDIPSFEFLSNNSFLQDTNQAFQDVFETTGLEAIMQRLDNWMGNSPIIKSSIRKSIFSDASRTSTDSAKILYKRYQSIQQSNETDIIEKIISDLIDEKIVIENTPRWLTLKPFAIDNYSVGVTNFNLYDGTAGILVFLSYATKVIKNKDLGDIVAQILDSMLNCLTSNDIFYTAGAFEGLTGILYGYLHARNCLNIRNYEFELTISEKIMSNLSNVPTFDIISGFSGILLFANNVLRSGCLDKEAAMIWRQIGNSCFSLLFSSTNYDKKGGAFWTNSYQAEKPICGFAHGQSGVAYALKMWGDFIGSDEAIKLSIRSMKFEASRFDQNLLGWVDQRNNSINNSWCYGAAGVEIALNSYTTEQLSQIGSIQLIKKMHVSASRGVMSTTEDCLCHSQFGNETIRMFQNIKKGNLQSTNFTISVMPENPGLMTGKAGIGLALLSKLHPGNIPDVFTLTI